MSGQVTQQGETTETFGVIREWGVCRSSLSLPSFDVLPARFKGKGVAPIWQEPLRIVSLSESIVRALPPEPKLVQSTVKVRCEPKPDDATTRTKVYFVWNTRLEKGMVPLSINVASCQQAKCGNFFLPTLYGEFSSLL